MSLRRKNSKKPGTFRESCILVIPPSSVGLDTFWDPGSRSLYTGTDPDRAGRPNDINPYYRSAASPRAVTICWAGSIISAFGCAVRNTRGGVQTIQSRQGTSFNSGRSQRPRWSSRPKYRGIYSILSFLLSGSAPSLLFSFRGIHLPGH